MTEQLKQILEEELSKMPQEINESITDFDWGVLSEEIGNKYALSEEETSDLQTEISLVLIGLVGIDAFAENLESNIILSKNEAEKISKEISEKIFKPIAEKIIEKIKNNPEIRNTSWEQNLNFILDDGDYMAFLKKIKTTEKILKVNSATPNETLLVNFLKEK